MMTIGWSTVSHQWLWMKLIIALAVMFGCVQPTEPILSIHRASRMSHVPSKTGFLNETFESPFEPKLHLTPSEHSSSVSSHTESEKNSTAIVTPMPYTRTEAVFYAFGSACMVGLTGIVPLLFFTSVNSDLVSDTKGNSKQLNRLLSFAVGGLLGDVFLHLLPEAWDHVVTANEDGSHNHWPFVGNGLWVLIGLISFCLLEKLFPDATTPSESSTAKHLTDNELKDHINNNLSGKSATEKDSISNGSVKQSTVAEQMSVKTSGYLNLLANCIDNFTHGLAVGGSYLVSKRVGMLTTFAILLHEIPHEMGDFAILLRAGLDRWRAAKLQVLTASGGLLGTAIALLAESAKAAGDRVAWILPFTSGGFIYVALCTVVPDILKETSPIESILQVFFILFGIAVMYGVSFIG